MYRFTQKSSIASKIFFILSKYLSFLRQEIGLTQGFLISAILYTKIYHFQQRSYFIQKFSYVKIALK